MAKEMKEGVADFQMDVFWIVHPGQDPVAPAPPRVTDFSR